MKNKTTKKTSYGFLYYLSWLIQIAYFIGAIYSMVFGLDHFTKARGFDGLMEYHLYTLFWVIPIPLVIASLVYLIKKRSVLFYYFSWLIQIAYFFGAIYSTVFGINFDRGGKLNHIEGLTLYNIYLAECIIPALLIIASLIYIIHYNKKKKINKAQGKEAAYNTDDGNSASV
ncbi:MAG: hypothetical protein IK999_06880 [Ruminococcus sp.]|nr:hypothetical protein [Ruminococcus sp.]